MIFEDDVSHVANSNRLGYAPTLLAIVLIRVICAGLLATTVSPAVIANAALFVVSGVSVKGVVPDPFINTLPEPNSVKLTVSNCFGLDVPIPTNDVAYILLHLTFPVISIFSPGASVPIPTLPSTCVICVLSHKPLFDAVLPVVDKSVIVT